MKTFKIIFWISTALVSAMMLMSGIMYTTKSEEMVLGFTTLGYPVYLMDILSVAKIAGALALLQPWWPRLRDWAYAGFTINFIGAIWSHVAIGDSFMNPVLPLLLLGISYFSLRMVQKKGDWKIA